MNIECFSCHYGRDEEDGKYRPKDDALVRCYRYPPTVEGVAGVYVHPKVYPGNWCGEFKAWRLDD